MVPQGGTEPPKNSDFSVFVPKMIPEYVWRHILSVGRCLESPDGSRILKKITINFWRQILQLSNGNSTKSIDHLESDHDVQTDF